MRVIYFNTFYAPYISGGAEVTLKQQVESLKNNGNEVLVVCLGPEKGVVREVVDGINVVRLGLSNMYFPMVGDLRPSVVSKFLWHWRDQDNLQVALQLKEIVNDFAPDVASCHNLSGLSISIWGLLSSLNIPVVQVLHDQYLLCPKTTMVNSGKVCLKQCLDCHLLRRKHAEKSDVVNVVVGVSKYIVDKMCSYGLFSKSVPFVINNVRNADLWADKSVVRPRSSSQLAFGFIGTISPIKGVERLLEAFVKAALGDHCRLLIAGRGDSKYVSELKSKYSDPRIQWLGYSNPSDFFSLIDVLVVPSIWHDTFPGVVFESFGFGVPVLGSSRGGIPEMIVNGLNGYLFDPEADGELEAYLLNISINCSTISSLSVAAIESSAKYSDISSWIFAYETAYQKAIDVKRIQLLDV